MPIIRCMADHVSELPVSSNLSVSCPQQTSGIQYLIKKMVWTCQLVRSEYFPQVHPTYPEILKDTLVEPLFAFCTQRVAKIMQIDPRFLAPFYIAAQMNRNSHFGEHGGLRGQGLIGPFWGRGVSHLNMIGFVTRH